MQKQPLFNKPNTREGFSTTQERSSTTRGRSSTLDILGKPRTVTGSSKAWAEHHAALNRLKEELTGQLSDRNETARQEIPTFSEHMADAATDSYERDYALAMLSSTQSTLSEIELALKRIFAGTYGICELTGDPIEPERLRAIPWTRFSARAQAELETKGASRSVQLGRFQLVEKVSETAEDDDEE